MPLDAEQYERIVRAYDQRYRRPTTDPGPWLTLGAVQHVERTAQGVRLGCEHGWLELHWITPDCVRVRLLAGPDDQEVPFSYSIARADWPVVAFDMWESSDALVMQSAALRCRIARQPFRMGLELLNNRVVYIDAAGPQWRRDGAIRLSERLHPQASCYGLGAPAGRLNLRGQRFSLCQGNDTQESRFKIPFCLSVQDNAVCGVLWDNMACAQVDLGSTHTDELVFEATAGPLVYYSIAADAVQPVLARLTELTGRIDLPPVWALGYQQKCTSCDTQAQVLETARTLREREIPCDVIQLGPQYMQEGRIFTWDETRFPDPQGMMRELHGWGFKVATTLHTSVSIDSEYAPYKHGFFRDVFLKYPDGKMIAIPAQSGMAHIPDFSKSATRDWWAALCQRWLAQGVDAVVNEVERKYAIPVLPDYIQYDSDGWRATGQILHNAQPILVAQATHNGLQQHTPEKRPCQLSDAGAAGSQRYGMQVTGACEANWQQLRHNISMCLNLGLSGFGLTGTDIGNCHDPVDAELFTRSLQAACLMPLLRVDLRQDNGAAGPWSFGQPYEVINRMTIQLRYRLLPYLYAVIAQCREYGLPVVRPLFMAEPENPDLRGIDDAYLLGDALLVAPVLSAGRTQRRVFLPRGLWYDFWTGEPVDGGLPVVVTAPLERLPLFVRAGMVLPLWPDMQYLGEKSVDRLTLRVYPGSGETVLYEDAGEGLNYQDGDYRWVYLTCDWEDDTLLIDRRVAGRYEPAYSGIRLEIIGLDEEPAAVRVDRKGAPLWFYDDDLLELSLTEFRRVEVTMKSQQSDRTLPHRDT